jgi:hypothetical protein
MSAHLHIELPSMCALPAKCTKQSLRTSPSNVGLFFSPPIAIIMPPNDPMSVIPGGIHQSDYKAIVDCGSRSRSDSSVVGLVHTNQDKKQTSDSLSSKTTNPTGGIELEPSREEEVSEQQDNSQHQEPEEHSNHQLKVDGHPIDCTSCHRDPATNQRCHPGQLQNVVDVEPDNGINICSTDEEKVTIKSSKHHSCHHIRCVHFASSHDEIHEIPSVQDMDLQEIRNVWYTVQYMLTMRQMQSTDDDETDEMAAHDRRQQADSSFGGNRSTLGKPKNRFSIMNGLGIDVVIIILLFLYTKAVGYEDEMRKRFAGRLTSYSAIDGPTNRKGGFIDHQYLTRVHDYPSGRCLNPLLYRTFATHSASRT